MGKAAASRRMSLEDMQRRAQGRVWTGVEAKALVGVGSAVGYPVVFDLC